MRSIENRLTLNGATAEYGDPRTPKPVRTSPRYPGSGGRRIIVGEVSGRRGTI
jgi:hypothetical protein